MLYLVSLNNSDWLDISIFLYMKKREKQSIRLILLPSTCGLINLLKLLVDR